jgi:hypothetical protein
MTEKYKVSQLKENHWSWLLYFIVERNSKGSVNDCFSKRFYVKAFEAGLSTTTSTCISVNNIFVTFRLTELFPYFPPDEVIVDTGENFLYHHLTDPQLI